MAKDPAFLFYSTDFYEGTRTMLPEERACYVDLMIYQHQRGPIPNDLKRVLLYCNGVDEATLKATLQAKFKLTSEGWINEKLAQIIEERKEYTEGQSKNGTVGQFWKKSKAILSKKEYNQLRDLLYNQTKEQIYERIKDLDINEASLKAMLEGLLKHLENENRDEDEDEIKNNIKGVQGENAILPLEPKKPKSDPDELMLSKIDIPEEHKETFLKWLKYKRKRQQSYKDEDSTQLAFNQLKKLSGNDHEKALKIVEKSMANNWAGLFELKEEKLNTNKNGHRHREVSCVPGDNRGVTTID